MTLQDCELHVAGEIRGPLLPLICCCRPRPCHLHRQQVLGRTTSSHLKQLQPNNVCHALCSTLLPHSTCLPLLLLDLGRTRNWSFFDSLTEVHQRCQYVSGCLFALGTWCDRKHTTQRHASETSYVCHSSWLKPFESLQLRRSTNMRSNAPAYELARGHSALDHAKQGRQALFLGPQQDPPA